MNVSSISVSLASLQCTGNVVRIKATAKLVRCKSLLT